MKIVEITGPRQAGVTERPDPIPAEDLVLVRIDSAPMCTEYKSYREGYTSSFLGHEAAGIVEAIAQPGLRKPGDRVVVMPQYPCGSCSLCLRGEYIYCQDLRNIQKITGSPWGTASYAQKMLKPDWLLIPIPDDVPTDLAAMACCGLGPTFGAMQTMHVTSFDTVLITGLGPVGLGGVINGVARGAKVLCVESNTYRSELAKRLGADMVFDACAVDSLSEISDYTRGEGVAAAIDCSGVESAQKLMISALKRRGRAAFVGESGELSINVSNQLLRKGITLHGQWHYNLSDTPAMMNMIQLQQDRLKQLITHTFPMSRVKEAFELQLEGNCGKVVLHPQSSLN